MKFVWRYTVPDTQTGFGAKYWMIPTLPIQKKFLRRTGTILTQSTSSSLLYSRWNLYEDSFQINPHISQIGHCVSYIYCVYMTLYIMCIFKKKTCNHQPCAWLLIMNCRLVWEITYLAVGKEMERVIMLNFTSTTLIFYVSAICFIKQNRTCIEWDDMSHFD